MPNIIDTMTAFIELQMERGLFTSFMKLACSAAPNPFPTFPFLQGRLIRSATFDGVGETLVPASVFAAMPGQVALSFPVTLNTITLDEFIQTPGSAGTTDHVHYIVTLSVAGTSLVASVVRVDFGPAQANQYTLPTPVVLATQSFQQQLGQTGIGNLVKGGAVLHEPNDDVIVVRLATTSLSLAQVNTWPVVSRIFSGTFPTKKWAIFLSGGTLATLVEETTNQQLASKLQPDVVIQTPLDVEWAQRDQTWGLDASVELDALGKCPTVFGGKDVSVTLNLRIDFVAQVANQAILLWAHVTHDTNKWDVFVCTLTNIVFGGFIPLAGIGIGFGSLVLLPGIVLSTVSQNTTSQNLQGFTKVNPPFGDDDETLTQLLPMPTIFPNNVVPNGDSLEAAIDQQGVTVRGTWVGLPPIPGTHTMQLTGNPITSEWPVSFNCDTLSNEVGALEMSGATIKDVFSAPGINPQPTPVQLFQVFAVGQADWQGDGKLHKLAPFQTFTAKPLVDPATHTGLIGKVYAHSSVGLAAADIAPLPPKPVPEQLSGPALILAKEKCQNWRFGSPQPSGGAFDLHWLVDPAPWEIVAGVMHEWAISFGAFAADTTAEIQLTSGRVTSSAQFPGTNQPMTVHLVTAAGDQLRMMIKGAAAVGGSVGQRLLIVSNTFPLAAPIRAIARANTGFMVLTDSQLLTMSIERGVTSAWDNRGATNLTEARDGIYLWGPSGAFQLTAIGLQPLITEAVHDVQPGPAQTIFHTEAGMLAAQQGTISRVGAASTPPVRATRLGLAFLRLDGQQVLVANAANLVVTQPGRFKMGAPTGRTLITLAATSLGG